MLEYACVVATSQSDKLESIQKRALRIRNGDVRFGMPYSSEFMNIKLREVFGTIRC